MTLYFAQLDIAKTVAAVGKASVGDTSEAIGAYLAACGGTELTAAQYQTIRAAPTRRFSLTESGLTDVTPTPDIATVRAAAGVRVDSAAELARQAFITPGAGQAMEYLATQTQAQAAAASPDPLDPALYPWLVAEQQAFAASGTTLSLRQVATAISGQITAWTVAGVEIKRLRRAAKLEINEAADAAAIAAIIAAISWPTP